MLQAKCAISIASVAAMLSVVTGARLAEGQTVVSQHDAHVILSELEARFQQRPASVYRFRSEYDLVSGKPGLNASLSEFREGEIRLAHNRVETFWRDTKWLESYEDYFPVRDYRYVWKDGTGVGLRTFLPAPRNERTREEAFTTHVQRQDSIRPDLAGWFADGVFMDSDHYSTVLLQSTVLAAVEDENGFIRISGKTEYGLLEVWITTGAQKSLSRARLSVAPEFVRKSQGLSAAVFEFEVLESREIEGHLFPIEALATYRYELNDGEEPMIKSIRTRRSDYQIRPDFEAMNAFEIDLPNGTVLISYDVPSNKYVWQDGRVRPYADVGG